MIRNRLLICVILCFSPNGLLAAPNLAANCLPQDQILPEITPQVLRCCIKNILPFLRVDGEYIYHDYYQKSPQGAAYEICHRNMGVFTDRLQCAIDMIDDGYLDYDKYFDWNGPLSANLKLCH